MTSQSSKISPLDFTGRRILVTGGAQGIGKAIAIKFLELNGTVIVLDKNVSRLEELNRQYPSIQTVPVDLGNWDETRKAVQAALPIHHLANNVGIAPVMPFLDIDENHIDTWGQMTPGDTALSTGDFTHFAPKFLIVFDINFKAALNVGQVVAKGMIANNITNGTIVSTSSISDTVALEKIAVYSSTKAALTMLTKSMAVELAPHGIRVNCVCPGLVDTELLSFLPEGTLEPIVNRLLFKRPSEPEAVADAFAFLSSTMSSRITATRLPVDQGYTAT